MRGALIGACLFEGWAATVEDAERVLAAGEIALDPCHHHRTVGPMAGVTSPSMWMWCLQDPATGAQAWCNLNEGLGKVLRMGAFNAEQVMYDHFGYRSPIPNLYSAGSAGHPGGVA